MIDAQIPDDFLHLLTDPIVVTFITVMDDGQPIGTPVWCDYDGTHILINTTVESQKNENIHNNPRVSIVSIDPQNPYRYLEVRGFVEEITKNGAEALIDKLAQQYTGKDKYYGGVAPAELAARQTRITYKIKPENTYTMG